MSVVGGLDVVDAAVVDLDIDYVSDGLWGVMWGVVLDNGCMLCVKLVVIMIGMFLNGVLYIGFKRVVAGRFVNDIM